MKGYNIFKFIYLSQVVLYSHCNEAPIKIPSSPHSSACSGTLRENLARPMHLTAHLLDCGRKSEHPEETHADTGRTCRLHTDSDPSQESNTGPRRYEAAVLTTVPTCCPVPRLQGTWMLLFYITDQLLHSRPMSMSLSVASHLKLPGSNSLVLTTTPSIAPPPQPA